MLTQLAKYPHVLYAKPSNKVYIFTGIRATQRHFNRSRSFFFNELTFGKKFCTLIEMCKTGITRIIIIDSMEKTLFTFVEASLIKVAKN